MYNYKKYIVGGVMNKYVYFLFFFIFIVTSFFLDAMYVSSFKNFRSPYYSRFYKQPVKNNFNSGKRLSIGLIDRVEKPSLWMRLKSRIPFTHDYIVRREAAEYFDHINAAGQSILIDPNKKQWKIVEGTWNIGLSQQEFVNARLQGMQQSCCDS